MSISFDRAADIYDKTRSLPDEVMARLIETLTAELKGYGEILDLGVGTGRFAEPLQKAGFEVVGIDISKRMMSRAKGKNVQNLLLGDARCIPFKDKAFDVTISVHVLHLISEWRRALRELCRVSRHALFCLHYAHREPVRQAYDQVLKKYGYERRRLGRSEQDLSELIGPTKSLFVTSYDTSADIEIENLRHRTSSSQWEIPEDVNLKAVNELETEFGGKTSRQDLYVFEWDIDQLRVRAEE